MPASGPTGWSLNGPSMPKAFDRMQLSISHNPIMRITEETPLTPDFLPPWLVGPFELIQQIIDALMQGFHGWFDRTGFDVGDLVGLGSTIGQSLGELNSVVQKLLARAVAGVFAIAENFSTYLPGLSLGPKWKQWYTGIGDGLLGIQNNFAQFLGGAVNRTALALFMPAEGAQRTLTDIQRIGTVFSVPANWGTNSFNFILGRANSGGTSGVFAKMSAGTAEIGYLAKDGVVRVLGAATDFRFKNGAAYWLEAGIPNSPRTFRLFENNALVLEAVDATAGSVIDAGNRFAGFATQAPDANTRPGVAAGFALYDNAPQAVTGSGFSRSRTLTGSADLSKGNQLFPNGWFNQTDYITPDYTYVDAGNALTVSAAGWYMVNIVQYATGGIILDGGQVRSTVRRNGTVVHTGPPMNSNQTVGMQGFDGTFLVYCDAGDVLQPGYISTWDYDDFLKTGDAGKSTYWTVNFMSNTTPQEGGISV